MSKKYFYLGTSKENCTYLLNWTGGVYGLRNKTLGIVLHDGGSGMGATAAQVASGTVQAMKNNADYPNYHNVVDHTGACYAVIMQDYATYSLGDKNPNDNFIPNDNYISIEIAPSLTGGDFKSQADKDKYKKAWLNGCKLVADYCVYYGLNENNVHQHKEFSATECPYTMKKYFGSYEKALSETKKQVKANIAIIKNGGTTVKATHEHFTSDKGYKQWFTYREENATETNFTIYATKDPEEAKQRGCKVLDNHSPYKYVMIAKSDRHYFDAKTNERTGTIAKGQIIMCNPGKA